MHYVHRRRTSVSGRIVPPPPSNLGCSGIRYRNVTVLPPGPPGLDSDHDGIGYKTWSDLASVPPARVWTPARCLAESRAPIPQGLRRVCKVSCR
jgi:hypothetical protein